MQDDHRRLGALFNPKTVAVLGASSKQRTRGNIVIENLRNWGFEGHIIPVHPSSPEIEGLPTVRSVGELPDGTDVAFVSVPAASVAGLIGEFDSVNVGAAVVITNGFSAQEEATLRSTAAKSRVLMHGPNCMGVINVSGQVPLYTAQISKKVKRGNVALLAQSGSAGVAILNSLDVGFSKVVTLGSEFRLTACEYMQWLAGDPDTTVIGAILESIQSPDDFRTAAAAVHNAGKRIVVLKVGRSAAGVLATQAHTGALIAPNDAYECFFRQLGIPMVDDYDEFVATLECMSINRRPASGSRLAIIGISGGETALACDIASEMGIPLATFSDVTKDIVAAALPGTVGTNPLDLGASVSHSATSDIPAVQAIANDPSVDTLVFLQDAQRSLPVQLIGKYRATFDLVNKMRTLTDKPVVLISPTGEPINEELAAALAGSNVPVVRGLRAGLAAAHRLGVRPATSAPAAHGAQPAELVSLRAAISAHVGALPLALCQRILRAYGIAPVSSRVVASSNDPAIDQIASYPVVAKISSPDIAHRSDIGGVVTGIKDKAALRAAVETIAANVKAAKPHARIDGFEIQDDLSGHVEVMLGFQITRPFGALTLVGSGGVLTEVLGSRAIGLGPLSTDEAEAMIRKTIPGKVLSGYRNLVAKTDLKPLAETISALSYLATDLSDLLAECDLNPVMVKPGSGEATVVDVLIVAADAKAGAGAKTAAVA